MIDYDRLDKETLFGYSKLHVFVTCRDFVKDFPGTNKWPANHPIWDCNIAGNKSPKEAWYDDQLLISAIDNLFWITNKSIEEEKYLDFVERIYNAFGIGGITLAREVLNRFTIAKICPKVTALAPSTFEKIIEESNIDISNGIYCPMAGFGGIIEGAKRVLHKKYKKSKEEIKDLIEAYDINLDFCNYYGWKQRDVLSSKIKTNKIVVVCPPFGTKTEQWPGTPMERNDKFKTNYLDFHDWCKAIKEYIDSPNYIFIGPEIKDNKPNQKCGLFKKKIGIQWYPEYSIL